MPNQCDNACNCSYITNLDMPMQETINIFGIACDSIVDGPGVRYAIFMQGCPHHCAGCQNPESWAMSSGHDKPISEIIDEVKRNGLLSGITLTGGDPFVQADKLCDLVDALHRECPSLDVWAWSGWTFEQLVAGRDDNKGMPAWWRYELLKRCDVLVDGRFDEKLKTLSIPWRGSSNQRVIRVKESLEAGHVVLHDDN